MKHIGLAVVLILFLTGCEWLRDYQEYPSDITIEELQKQMNESSDPDGLYRNAHSYIMKQTLTRKGIFSDDDYMVEVKFKRPGLWKTTTFKDNKPMNAVMFNGRKAWIVDYRTRTSTELTGTVLARVSHMQTLLLPDSTFQDSFEKVALTQYRKNGIEYYKIVGQNTGFDPITIYIGKYTSLPKRVETREVLNGMKVNYLSIMDSYAMYDRVMIANQNTVVVDNTTSISRVVQYRLNVELSDSEFLPAFD